MATIKTVNTGVKWAETWNAGIKAETGNSAVDPSGRMPSRALTRRHQDIQVAQNVLEFRVGHRRLWLVLGYSDSHVGFLKRCNVFNASWGSEDSRKDQ